MKMKRRILLLLLVLAGAAALSAYQAGRKDQSRVINGMAVTPPAGFQRRYSDSRFAVWEYEGKDKKPGRLILDADIRGDHAQAFPDAEAVLAACPWLTEAELYVNPQGVRMARGYSTEYSGRPERRYYVESQSSVFLLCMQEDGRYYDAQDCEEAILQAADSIRPAR